MKRFSLLLLCLLCGFVQGAQIVRYVDPDAAGAGNGTSWADAYTSLSAWEAAEQQDLTDAGGDYMTVYCRSSAATADTTTCTIAGWTTNATSYIEIIGFDFPTDGIFDATKYHLKNNNANTYTLLIQTDYVRVHNIQHLVVQGVWAVRHGIWIDTIGAASDIRIDSNIVKGSTSAWGNINAITINDASATVSIYNTVIYDWVASSSRGINVADGTVNCYNDTVYNVALYGIIRTAGTLVAKNCAVGLTTDDFFFAAGTVDYCCSDDGDGTNAQGPSGGSWANEFTATAGGDFSLVVGGNCEGNGTDNPGSGLYSDDIIDTARNSTWDIGAFEIAAAPPAAGGQVIIVEME